MTTISNLFKNPSVEVNTNGWVGKTATVTRDTTKAVSGSASIMGASTNNGASSIAWNDANTVGMPVVGNAKYWHSFSAAHGNASLRAVTPRIAWYDASNVLISEVVIQSGGLAVPTGGAFARSAVFSVVAPSNAAWATVRYSWNFGNADPVWIDAVIFTDAQHTTYFDGDTAGYKWDGTPHASTSSVYVAYPPVVDAGVDQTIRLPATVVALDASVSDANNDPVTTTWTKASGPGTVTFANASAVDTTATFSAAGDYVLTLTASDGLHTITDDVTVTVKPPPPFRVHEGALIEVNLAGTWTDITGPTKNITIGRGDSDVGLMSAEVLDASLDPTTAATLRPGRQVRVRAKDGTDWKTIYTGAIDNVDVDYDPRASEGKTVNVRISASDAVSYLSNQMEPRGVAAINDLRGIVTGVPFIINGQTTGTTTVTPVSMNDNASIWDNILITRDSNLGYAWVDADNRLNVFDHAVMDTSVKATIGPETYSEIDVDFTLDQIINSVTVNWMRYNIGTETAAAVPYGPYENDESKAEWGTRSATFTVQGAVEDEAAIASFAQDVLNRNATAEVRPRSVVIHVRNVYDLALIGTLDLNHRVNVVFADGETTKNMRVTGIDHNISPDKWTVTYEFGLPFGVTAPSQAPGTGTSYIPPGSIGTPELDDGVVDDIEAGKSAAVQAQEALDAAEESFEYAKTRNKVYYQTTKPSGAAFVDGDIWFDTDDGKKMYVYQTNDFVVATGSNLITPNGRLYINPNGLYATNSGGGTTFALNAADGSINMTGPITTGGSITGANITASSTGVIQTESTASRGIKMNSAGFTAYDSAGSPTFTITASTGAVAMKGTLTSGSTITGATLQTAASGKRVVVDGSNTIKFYPTIAVTNPGTLEASVIDPGTTDERPAVTIGSGTTSSKNVGASIYLQAGASTGVNPSIELDATFVDVSGTLVASGGISSAGTVTFSKGMTVSGATSTFNGNLAYKASGQQTLTTNGSGQVTFAHGMGVAPKTVFVQRIGGGFRHLDVYSISATNVVVEIRNGDNTLTPSGNAITFCWVAIL